MSSERVIEPHEGQIIEGADGDLDNHADSDIEGTGTKGTARGHNHGTLDTSRVTDDAAEI